MENHSEGPHMDGFPCFVHLFIVMLLFDWLFLCFAPPCTQVNFRRRIQRVKGVQIEVI